jgi:hypothetical protein
MRRRRSVTGWATKLERPLTARRPNDIAQGPPLIACRSRRSEPTGVETSTARLA